MSGDIDAHQHFWRPARGDYGWLTPALGALYRDFGADDLSPLLGRHGIARTVLVQAAPSEAETDELLEIASRCGFVAGVVGWVDLAARDAPDRIARRAADPLFRGVRPMIQDLPDDAWMLGHDLSPSFRALIETGLAFDALVKPRHLAHLVRLVERHPELRVVIDHGAKPDIAQWRPGDASFRAWAGSLDNLAGLGCFAKLSGLVTEAGTDWSVDDLRPYVDALTEAFGPDRLMWGSDWPVVNLAGGYDRWREASIALVQGCGEPERGLLFGGSAARFYRLGPT